MSLSLDLAESERKQVIGAKSLMILSFCIYALTWVLLPLAVNTTLNRDTIQIVYWGLEWQPGFFKHPPLISWMTEIAFALFGVSDAVVYGLSAAVMLASFAFVHLLARRYVEPMSAALAVATLPVLGYYSYIIPHFNHNIVLNLPWCAAIWLAYMAIEERRSWAWPLLGLTLGLGILAKYTILILPLLLLVHVVATPQHRWVLRAPPAWAAVGLCLLVAGPHIHWVVTHDLGPLRYLSSGAGLSNESFLDRHLVNPVMAVLIMAGMCASLGIALVGGLGLPRPQRKTLCSRNRFLLLMSLGPAALVVMLSAVTGGGLRVEWASSFFLTLPLLLLHLFYPVPAPWRVNRLLAWTSGLMVAMGVTYVLIFTGLIADMDEGKWSRFPGRPLAAATAEGWAEVCDGPVPMIIADAWLGGTASYRLRERPRVYSEADPRMAPWLSDGDIRRTGAIILWDQALDGRYRDIDHQDAPKPGEPLDWFPGIPALEARFGPITALSDVTLDYPGPVPQAPVRLGRAVIPPAIPCR
ncbi:glycosyltransferase [Paramagnetospirillum caucaseum]|uniref:Glycosyltransferase n=1 Tax=Paramagnetospirillum caucaseum TaxID=1244869 RepID=M3A823_9PROT|nr:glycosyltransferase family 39 protein [Paramagnetospirillum caucaseum]EME68629.1 glycosyltransferase [Paramagnetospirillum caucaseum]